jgi:hypothetical protein
MEQTLNDLPGESGFAASLAFGHTSTSMSSERQELTRSSSNLYPSVFYR